MIKKTRYLIATAALLCALVTTAAAAGPEAQQKNIILATTTSTQDSGLLDALLPVFEKQNRVFCEDHSCRVRAGHCHGRQGRG